MDTPTDSLTLLRSLTADALQTRLDELLAEADAVRVLLRSARARERRQHRVAPADGGTIAPAAEVAHG